MMRALLARIGRPPIALGLPLVVATLFALAVPDFRAPGNWANVGAQIAPLVVVALGQLLVALVGGIDLSIGAVVSLTNAILVGVAHPGIALTLALAAGLTVGLVNGVGVAFAGVHPLVMTLATATFTQGLTFLLLPVPGGRAPAQLLTLVGGEGLGLPRPLLVCALVAAVVAFVLHRSRLGLHLYAVGAQPRSAELNGVNRQRVLLAAYAACSALGVAAGVLLTARIASGDPAVGMAYALDSVTAIALGGVQLTGGVGGVVSVLAGALTLGLISNGINLFGISPFLRGAVTGALLIAAVAAQRRKGIGL